MTWKQEAAQIIQQGMRGAPEDMTLKDRCKAVSDLCPPSWRFMSWPQKAWQAARRDYLAPYGYKPKTKKAQETEAASLPLFGEAP